METICKLRKESIVDLIKETVFKTIDKNDIKNISKVEIYLSKLAIILLATEKTDIEFFRKKLNKDIYQNLDEKEISRIDNTLKLFLENHNNWVQKNCNLTKNSMEEIEKFEDDFFDFDSEEVDENINNMHYSDDKKISAVEFMKEDLLDSDFVAEIVETLENLDDLLYQFDGIEINDEFIKRLISFDSFIKVFNFSIEFKDIGYALETLKEKLILLDLSSLNQDQKMILKTFISTIIDDLKNWVEMVVINKTAQDIHYLDASLLANIAQMDIMMDSFKDKNDNNEEDMEFF
jgi:hypothetical protein